MSFRSLNHFGSPFQKAKFVCVCVACTRFGERQVNQTISQTKNDSTDKCAQRKQLWYDIILMLRYFIWCYMNFQCIPSSYLLTFQSSGLRHGPGHLRWPRGQAAGGGGHREVHGQLQYRLLGGALRCLLACWLDVFFQFLRPFWWKKPWQVEADGTFCIFVTAFRAFELWITLSVRGGGSSPKVGHQNTETHRNTWNDSRNITHCFYSNLLSSLEPWNL